MSSAEVLMRMLKGMVAPPNRSSAARRFHQALKHYLYQLCMKIWGCVLWSNCYAFDGAFVQ